MRPLGTLAPSTASLLAAAAPGLLRALDKAFPDR